MHLIYTIRLNTWNLYSFMYVVILVLYEFNFFYCILYLYNFARNLHTFAYIWLSGYAFLMIMIQFFLKFLELNVPTRKTEKTAAVPPLPPKTAVCRWNFFMSFFAELDNSESFETNFFFEKNSVSFCNWHFFFCYFSPN